jgi:hypothetical protein
MKFEPLSRSAWVKWCATGKCESPHTSDGSQRFQTNTYPWHHQRRLLIGREGVTRIQPLFVLISPPLSLSSSSISHSPHISLSLSLTHTHTHMSMRSTPAKLLPGKLLRDDLLSGQVSLRRPPLRRPPPRRPSLRRAPLRRARPLTTFSPASSSPAKLLPNHLLLNHLLSGDLLSGDLLSSNILSGDLLSGDLLPILHETSSSPTEGKPCQLLSGNLSSDGGGLFFEFQKNTHSAQTTLPAAQGLVRYE